MGKGVSIKLENDAPNTETKEEGREVRRWLNERYPGSLSLLPLLLRKIGKVWKKRSKYIDQVLKAIQHSLKSVWAVYHHTLTELGYTLSLISAGGSFSPQNSFLHVFLRWSEFSLGTVTCSSGGRVGCKEDHQTWFLWQDLPQVTIGSCSLFTSI